MTISSSLNAGVMGLNVNASRLGTISDNIANSQTYGYKRSDVDFSSLVIHQSRSIYSAGGVRAQSYKDVTIPGPLISTGRSTDIAINGRGMIPVTDLQGKDQSAQDRNFLMAPTGSFLPDEDGYLRTNSGLFLMGWPTDGTGNALNVSRTSTGSLEPVQIGQTQFSTEPTLNMALGINLPAELPVVGGTFELPVEYFDPLGLTQTMNFEFTRDTAPGAPPNSWNITATSSETPPQPAAEFNVVFSDGATDGGSLLSVTPISGTNYDAVTGEISLTVGHGNINAFIGRLGEGEGLTQVGTSFAPFNVIKDGAPAGELQSIDITDDGFVEAIYTNGNRRKIFQIPVAEVPNPNGLTAVSNQAFTISVDSGDLYLWDAGTGPTGSISNFSLMESNTDIASELTALIETQRAYSSNAKIIQTVDEMLQETTNLKR